MWILIMKSAAPWLLVKARCLVVDATQGIEAQTLANLYLALDADLVIIPVINKIDLISAQPDEVAEDIAALLGVPADDILRISAKEGTNVDAGTGSRS